MAALSARRRGARKRYTSPVANNSLWRKPADESHFDSGKRGGDDHQNAKEGATNQRVCGEEGENHGVLSG